MNSERPTVNTYGDGVEIKMDKRFFDALDRALERLPDAVFRNVVRQASNRALKPVLKRAKQLVGRRTGLLRKSLSVKQKTYARTGVVYSIVGARSMKDPETGENPVNIAHLVEYGTKAHKILPETKKAMRFRSSGLMDVVVAGVNHPGAKAKPFMRPAYDEKKHEVLRIMQEDMGKGIGREIDKVKGPVP